MDINKKKDSSTMTLEIVGRLDTMTAPSLEAVISDELDGITNLVFDFAQLEYISSAGLRVILGAQKKMNKIGKMTIVGVNDAVMEVFDVTGFVDILNFE